MMFVSAALAFAFASLTSASLLADTLQTVDLSAASVADSVALGTLPDVSGTFLGDASKILEYLVSGLVLDTPKYVSAVAFLRL